MLQLEGVGAVYGDAGAGARVALRGIDLCVSPGQVLGVSGSNGAGLSTLARVVAGLHPWPSVQGRVSIAGRDVRGLEASAIARLGLAYVPQDRRVFALLTVQENLQLALQGPAARAALGVGLDLAAVFAHFPALLLRRQVLAGALSGGEQQMLAVARALLCRPRCLVLDEVSEGLAEPVLLALRSVLQDLVAQGLALLLIEQRSAALLGLADARLHLERGQLVHSAG